MKKNLFNSSNVVMYKAKRQKYIGLEKLTVEVVSDVLGGGGVWLPSQSLTFKQ